MKRPMMAFALALLVAPAWAEAVVEAGRAGMAELGEPYVPPANRHPSSEAPTSGAALQAQVDEKLRQQFAAADTGGTGLVTKEQARRAGWGYLVRRFEQIDTAARGSVSFEQVRDYQRAAARLRKTSPQ